MRVDRAVVALVVIIVTTTAPRARAAIFTVNSAADTTDGVCGPAAGGCTLREAIEAAVATAGRDTIRFDPAVFPPSPPTGIALTTPLPIIADAAGTVIDGAGAGVHIGGGAVVANGLVFASPPGVPLVKVVVANLILGSFADMAVHICGGGPPECQGDVSGALVQHVAVTATQGDGIRLEGLVVTKSRVLDSVVSRADGCGILFFGGTAIMGARVQGCTAVGSGACGGIVVHANQSVVGATIADSVAVRGAGIGIGISAPDVTKAKLASVVASDNDDTGIEILADDANAGTNVSDALVSGNGGNGIDVAGAANTAVAIQDVVIDGASSGIHFSGPTSGAKITHASAVSSFHGIDLFDTGSGVTGAKLSDIVVAASEVGAIMKIDTSVLTQIRASSNAAAGLTISQGGGGNTITKSRANANATTGIRLFSSSANLVQKNVALGNGGDLFDDAADCDANTWKANIFRTGNQSCIH